MLVDGVLVGGGMLVVPVHMLVGGDTLAMGSGGCRGGQFTDSGAG